MLELTRLEFSYGAEKFQFDLTVSRGEIVALIGPSGAGKSTLLLLVGGFLQASGGSILLDGRDITGLGPERRPVSTIFQEHNLFPHLTAYQNVAIGVDPGLRLNDEQRARVEAAMQRTYLGGLQQRLPGALSGGQRQRISIARVLARQQPVLLLDEALTGLGPSLRTELLALINELVAAESMSAIMVSHHPEDALKVCPRIAFMQNGSIDSVVSAEQLASGEVNPSLAEYLGHD